jgi:AAA domain
MSPVSFRPAKRENVPLLLGVAGGTGSGKTTTALRLAKGLAGDKRPAMIDTESGRALHYADQFAFDHATLGPPFRPQAYLDAIKTADAAGYPVIVVDSMSHEWDGIGGMLDWHDEIQGGNAQKKLMAWIEPKSEHRRFVNELLQLNAHVILCFRAAQKVEMVKVDGKWEIVAKQSLTGVDGWIPICEKALPFELTMSLMLMADRPGVPHPIKLEGQHRPFVPLDTPITEATGMALGRWAAGAAASSKWPDDVVQQADALTKEILALAPDEAATRPVIARQREKYSAEPGAFIAWLGAQLERLRAAAEDRDNADIPLS